MLLGIRGIVPLVIASMQLALNLFFGKIYANLQKKFMLNKDLRMRALDEMMAGIKPIKYNSMETIFDQKVFSFL